MQSNRSADNRRNQLRHPVGFYALQLIDDEPHRAFATNLSNSGIYLERVTSLLQRRSTRIQLELGLPEDLLAGQRVSSDAPRDREAQLGLDRRARDVAGAKDRSGRTACSGGVPSCAPGWWRPASRAPTPPIW